MTDCFIQVGLSLVDPDNLECLLAVLFILSRNKELRVVLPLFVFTRLFSVVIKGIIAVPLPDGVEMSYGFLGYSFPSGHIHISSIFYVWLIWNANGYFLKLLLFITISAGMYSEVIAGFHRPVDVCFAPLFALAKCWLLFKIRFSETGKLILISVLSIFFVGSMFVLSMNRYTDGNPYTFITLYKVLGFCASYISLKKIGFKAKALFSMCILGIVSLFAQLNDYVWINQLKWVFIAAMLPITNHAIHFMIPRIKFSKRRSEDGVAFSMVFTRSKSHQLGDM